MAANDKDEIKINEKTTDKNKISNLFNMLYLSSLQALAMRLVSDWSCLDW